MLCVSGELVQMARVPWVLELSRADQPNSGSWITGVDEDFEGTIYMAKPLYLVEIGTGMADDEDDNEENDKEEDDDEGSEDEDARL